MKVFVNNKEVIIHWGAKVLDVLRSYYAEHKKKIPSKLPNVTDAYGNSVAHDGELTEGNHLYINTNKTMKAIRKIKSITTKLKVTCGIVVLGTSLLIGCGTSRKAAKQPKEKAIEILAVNDMHAAIDNFPRFAFMVDSLRAIYPHLLLVSGGDNQTGNPANDQYPEKGMPIIELMNAVNFDLSAVGNHEFDSRLAGF